MAGPIVAIAFIAAGRLGWQLDPAKPLLNDMAGIGGLMAIWWLSEALPTAVTGILPLVLFPVLGLAPIKEVEAAYGNRVLFLFLGGFLIALAMQESGLHKRIALGVMAAVGGTGTRLVLGMVLATGLISMWMSNTATTIMMLPIATSLLTQVDAAMPDPRVRRNFGAALVLGVAYAASLGGMATLIGTPTNAIFKELYLASFGGSAPEITFGGWMLLGAPISLAALVACWLLLAFVVFPIHGQIALGDELIASERAKLGPLSTAEFRSGAIFLATALLWIFREPLPGWGWAPVLGWGQPKSGRAPVDDTTIAMAMAVLCFVVPTDRLRSAPLLPWKAAAQVPWGVLLLFGGGLALAEGMKHTGLDQYLGQALGRGVTGYSPLVITAVTALAVTLLSELTSNIACVTITVPVLAGLAASVDCDPRLLMISATLAASCGFMLPVATAANAIAYGTGRASARDMARAGLLLDLIGVALIVALVYLLGGLALGISTEGAPDWAKAAAR